MNLSGIEKKYHFKYPNIYKELDKDGMLWYESKLFSKLKENPPLLLHTYDFELIIKEEIVDEKSGAISKWNFRLR